MGIIAEIIEHSKTENAAEQDRFVVDTMLSQERLDKIHTETFKSKMLVPDSRRNDTFRDGVLSKAREIQVHWSTHVKAMEAADKQEREREANNMFLETKDKEKKLLEQGKKFHEQYVKHQSMIDQFDALKKEAQDWLNKDKGKNEAKTGYCEDFKEVADRGKRLVERRRLHDVGKWLSQQKPPKTPDNPHPSMGNPRDAAAREKTIQQCALEFGISEVEAKTYLLESVEMLAGDAKALLPTGFVNPAIKETSINLVLPDTTRPKLDLNEATALADYCVAAYAQMNKALYGRLKGIKIDSPATDEQRQLFFDTMINDVREVYRKTLEDAKLAQKEQAANTLQAQKNFASEFNQIPQATLRKMSLDEFKTKLKELGFPEDIVMKQADKFDNAFIIQAGKKLDLEKQIVAAEKAFNDPESTPDGQNCKTYAKRLVDLQSAFAKAKPIYPPITTQRGLKFSDRAVAVNYVQELKNHRARKEVFPMEGFQSTSTAPVPKIGRADGKNELYFVKLKILAKRGLDALPYAGLQEERELLLDQGTMMWVSKDITEKQKNGCTQWDVLLEQILDK